MAKSLFATLVHQPTLLTRSQKDFFRLRVAPDKPPEEKHHKAVMCMKIASKAVLYSEKLQEHIKIGTFTQQCF